MVVLVVSVHPDDEVIGAGGTILKHKKAGDKVIWLIVTGLLKDEGFSEERIYERALEIKNAAKAFNFDEVIELNIPTMKIDSSSVIEMIPRISKVVTEYQPEVIYTVNRSDAHSDHRYTFDAVIACTKTFRYPFVKKVLMYECISETEFAPALHEKAFLPNYFVDVSEFMNQKLEIASLYQSEMGEHPFPRSTRNLEALGVFRGAQAGVEYAEAFQLVKYIDK